MNYVSMFVHPLLLWDEWAMVIGCAMTCASCFLHLNALPRCGQTPEKLVVLFAGLGAFGLMVSPFFEVFTKPNIFELLFSCSMAVVACWLTRGEWRELLPQRSPSPAPKPMMKGLPTEEEDACFH